MPAIKTIDARKPGKWTRISPEIADWKDRTVKDHYRMFAAYNAWANRLLYEAAGALSPAERATDTGAFFGPILNTLNHILVADRIWLHRFTGTGPLPTALDDLPYGEFADLQQARLAEDERILAFVESLSGDRLAGTFTYSPIGRPERITQKLGSALAHFFNHQTHHRGQAHATLTALHKPSLTLDLVYFLRAEGKSWL